MGIPRGQLHADGPWPGTFDEGPTAGGPTTEAAKASSIRQLRVNQPDLDEHGYYTTCPQCIHIQWYGRPRPGVTHITAGRGRTTDAMKLTDKGRARLELQDGRAAQANEGTRQAFHNQLPLYFGLDQ